jgi:hypothetical protein
MDLLFVESSVWRALSATTDLIPTDSLPRTAYQLAGSIDSYRGAGCDPLKQMVTSAVIGSRRLVDERRSATVFQATFRQNSGQG